MTVQADDRRREYTATGLTNTFNGPMAYEADVVQVFTQAALTGSPIVLLNPSDYEVQRVGREGGTRIVLDSTPVAGTKILILRTMPFDQLVDITNQSAFNADVLERGLDLLAMQIQQLDDGSMQLVFDTDAGTFAWDAKGLRIINVGDPLLNQDAVNLRSLLVYVESVLSGGGVVGVTPQVFTWTGDGVTHDIPVPGADVSDAGMYDTYLEMVPSAGDFVGMIPGEDFFPVVHPDPLDSVLHFAVAPGAGIRGFSVLRGYARPWTGETPITTTAPEIIRINDNTLLVDGRNQNTLILSEANVPVTITIRVNTGDEELDWKDGQYFSVCQIGTGKVTLAIEGGGELLPPDDFLLETRAHNSIISASCVFASTDAWRASGDLLRVAVEPSRQVWELTDRSVLIGTNATTGTAKDSFIAPFDFKLDSIAMRGCYAGLAVAQAAGSLFTVDVNVNGTSILSTKLTFDNAEKTTLTAATPAVYDAAFVAANYVIPAAAEVTIDIDVVGTALAKGLRVYLVGVRAS